eukprot:1156129-Pelagomonas_calceolata.AAC.2
MATLRMRLHAGYDIELLDEIARRGNFDYEIVKMEYPPPVRVCPCPVCTYSCAWKSETLKIAS